MQSAPHPEEAAARDSDRPADLPTVSDTTLMFFAAGSLIVTAVALFVLFD